MTFQSLDLHEALLRAVEEEGYTIPTPIQAAAIPAVIAGKDLLAAAQTGTGKTAGFTLPMLHKLANNPIKSRRPKPRALILTPTRELAAQVEKSVMTYGRHLQLRTAVVYGGANMVPQIKRLRSGVDIVVATPGRLLDHIRQNNIDLKTIEMFILDEADRMLDMGFIHDINTVIGMMPENKQSLLFSATFSKEIKKLSQGLLNEPELIEVARENSTAERVTQTIHPVDRAKKTELLTHLIGSKSWGQTLVFTRTKRGADQLSKELYREGIRTDSIHGDKSQRARMKVLENFKHGRIQVLVATDVAARGLDIEHLPHVVNFDMPEVPEDYIHRIGRTGRAGKSGEAISLVSSGERNLLSNIERLLKTKLSSSIVEGFAPVKGDFSSRPSRGGEGQGRGRGGQGNKHKSSFGNRSDSRNDSRRDGQKRNGQKFGRKNYAQH